MRAVGTMLYRPRLGLRAKYYSTLFLSQLVLSRKGEGPLLARQLIELYFGLFASLADVEKTGGKEGDKKEENDASRGGKGGNRGGKSGGKRGEKGGKKGKSPKGLKKGSGPEEAVNSKLLAVVLRGINRALPFVRDADVADVVHKHSPALFRLVHSQHFGLAVQALSLLYRLLSWQGAESARLHRALYSLALSPQIQAGGTHLALFLGVVQRALKASPGGGVASAVIRRLLQVALHCQPGATSANLVLTSALLQHRPSLWYGF